MIPLKSKVIALGARLRRCRNVTTLGVRPNLEDYSPAELAMIRGAPTIYHPGSLYAATLLAMGKNIFPSRQCYDFAQDKIRQTSLFQCLEIPHPRTRFYFGKRQQENILQDFTCPFVAKIPRGSSRGKGVFMIRNPRDLYAYTSLVHTAYIQEYIPLDRDLRVLVIGKDPVCAYWRMQPENGWTTNVSTGGIVDFSGIPEEAVALAVDAARACGFDDVGMDVCLSEQGPLVLEANMKYGLKGLKQAGIDYFSLMEGMIRDGKI